MKVTSKSLKKLLRDIFQKFGLSKVHSNICANAIINAELVGAPSHGLSRLKMYCERIKKKVINPKPKIKIKKKFHNQYPLLMLIIVLGSLQQILN